MAKRFYEHPSLPTAPARNAASGRRRHGHHALRQGASSEQCLEYLNISRPAWVSEVHQAYATAGRRHHQTHTFGANRDVWPTTGWPTKFAT